MRYAWLPETDERRLAPWAEIALRGLAPWFKRRDRRAAQRPSSFVANSTAVAGRVSRFYGRTATVIHPPVEVEDFRHDGSKDPNLFLWAHRLVPYKRPDLVAEAFRGLPYRLTMVGVGPLEAELRSRLPPNVELHAWLPRDELVTLFSTASGFIHIAEEDFGISMVEALASGVPVIALARGGATDIVRPNRDGLLLETASVEGLRDAARELHRRHWERQELRLRAEEFAAHHFEAKMRRHVGDLLAQDGA
jgi:glycosyltransferase involved in cell wall biosynthesis